MELVGIYSLQIYIKIPSHWFFFFIFLHIIIAFLFVTNPHSRLLLFSRVFRRYVPWIQIDPPPSVLSHALDTDNIPTAFVRSAVSVSLIGFPLFPPFRFLTRLPSNAEGSPRSCSDNIALVFRFILILIW